MKYLIKIAKGLGVVLLSLGILLVAAFAAVYVISEKKIRTEYSYKETILSIPTDVESIKAGAHLYNSRDCADCHGKKLEGKVFMDDAMLLKLTAPNLTKGEGGLPSDYGSKDWIRVLRHGVDTNGHSLLMMPSHEISKLTDEDMARLIAYCMSRPPVNTRRKKMHHVGPVGRALILFGEVTVLPAAKIDHAAPSIASNKADTTAAYGRYLSVGCQGCHRADMRGGAPLAPSFPEVPDITSAGRPGKWTEASFIKTLQTGVTPDGEHLRNEFMPWQNIRNFTVVELKAIYRYLQSLP